MFGINNEALLILAVLSPGYISFRISEIGAGKKTHEPIQVFFSTGIFATVNYTLVLFLLGLLSVANQYAFLSSILVTSILTGGLWNKPFSGYVLKLSRKLSLTNEDSPNHVWWDIFNNSKVYATQIIAHLNDGTVLMCDHTRALHRKEYDDVGVFPYYTDRKGNIYFIPTHYKYSLSGKWVDMNDVDGGAEWGLRVTYLRKENITRLDVRLAPEANVP